MLYPEARGIVSAARVRRVVTLLILAFVAVVSMAACETEEEETPGASPTTSASALGSPSPSSIVTFQPTATPVDASSSPTPAPGYAWWSTAAAPEFGLSAYTLQIPETWIGVAGNPAYFSAQPPAPGNPRVLTALTPTSSGYEHPTLFNLPQMGTTCSGNVPGGQVPGGAVDAPDATPNSLFTGDVYTWDVYLFSCEERLTAGQVGEGQEPTRFDVRAAEARAGEFIISVTAFEDPESGAAEAEFDQALRTFRVQ